MNSFQVKCECGIVACSTVARKYICVCGRQMQLGDPSGKSRGLGDTIHKITTALHIPHCGGCEQRRDALNNLIPYKQG